MLGLVRGHLTRRSASANARELGVLRAVLGFARTWKPIGALGNLSVHDAAVRRVERGRGRALESLAPQRAGLRPRGTTWPAPTNVERDSWREPPRSSAS